MLTKTIAITNEMSQLDVVANALELLADEWNLMMEETMKLNLVIEEVVTNIINYGYHDHEAHTINIRLSLDGNLFTMQIIDDAIEFNPLLQAKPDINLSLEDRKIGGLGIHFMRTIMDHLEYSHEDGKNILTLSKKLAGA